MTAQVGQIVVARVATGVCDVGEIGVVYEVYAREWRGVGGAPGPGISVIFASGRHDGFSPDEVESMLTVTDNIEPGVANYRFTNVVQLVRDYRAGTFSKALGSPPSQ